MAKKKTIEAAVDAANDKNVELLTEFAELYRTEINGKSVLPYELAKRVHGMWNQFSGRSDRMRGNCSPCIMNAINHLKNGCRNYGISYE